MEVYYAKISEIAVIVELETTMVAFYEGPLTLILQAAILCDLYRWADSGLRVLMQSCTPCVIELRRGFFQVRRVHSASHWVARQ